MGDLRPEAVFSGLWKIILKKYYIIERPSVIPGTSKHEKFNWFMWLYVLHKSVTWASSQISWGQKKCLQFWQTKVAIFFSIHVGNCYMNWHEFQHVYVWRINVQVSYPYTREKSDNVLSLWHHLLAFIFFHNLSNLLWHIVILSMKSWENPKWMMF